MSYDQRPPADALTLKPGDTIYLARSQYNMPGTEYLPVTVLEIDLAQNTIVANSGGPRLIRASLDDGAIISYPSLIGEDTLWPDKRDAHLSRLNIVARRPVSEITPEQKQAIQSNLERWRAVNALAQGEITGIEVATLDLGSLIPRESSITRTRIYCYQLNETLWTTLLKNSLQQPALDGQVIVEYVTDWELPTKPWSNS